MYSKKVCVLSCTLRFCHVKRYFISFWNHDRHVIKNDKYSQNFDESDEILRYFPSEKKLPNTNEQKNILEKYMLLCDEQFCRLCAEKTLCFYAENQEDILRIICLQNFIVVCGSNVN